MFPYDDQLEAILQVLLSHDDANLRGNTLRVVDRMKWVRVSLIEKLIEVIPRSTYICKVSGM